MLALFLILATSLCFAWWKQQPFRTGRWRHHYWLAFAHLLVWAAALVLGTFFRNPLAAGGFHESRLGMSLVQGLWYGSLLSCAYWIWRMKGFRWYAVSLMALMELASAGTLFVAAMSITGDWI